MGARSELYDAVVQVCRRVQHLVDSFTRNRDPRELDYLIFQVSKLNRILLAVNCGDEILEALGQSLTLLQALQDSGGFQNLHGYAAPRLVENRRGRPRLDIRREQLEYLLHFTCPKIAEIIGVSLSTVRRRMTDYGLCVRALYSDVTDQEPDSLVSTIKKDVPSSGYRLTQGHLLCQGYQVNQIRIRESMHRVDPEGTAIRCIYMYIHVAVHMMSPNVINRTNQLHEAHFHKSIVVYSCRYQMDALEGLIVTHTYPRYNASGTLTIPF